MTIYIVSTLIHVVNISVTILCNFIIKLSDRVKPEALNSELDLIFHDALNFFSLAIASVNGYPLISIFFEEIDPVADALYSAFHLTLVCFFMTFTGWTFVVKLIYIYQKTALLEEFTYEQTLWTVRFLSIGIVSTIILHPLFIHKYPYVPLIYPDLINTNISSNFSFSPLYQSENPSLYFLCLIDMLMLLAIMIQKIKRNDNRNVYIKAAAIFTCLIANRFVNTFIVLR